MEEAINKSAATSKELPEHSGQFQIQMECLAALVDRELRYEETLQMKKSSQYSPPKSEITPGQRDIAVEWMHEVVLDCLGLDKDTETSPATVNKRVDLSGGQAVFVHAVSILDNFLSICPILPDQLQLLASSCLLLSAKVRTKLEDKLSEDALIDYTDRSITKTELKAWEMLVLSKLNWDLHLVLPQDYLAILVKINLLSLENLSNAETLCTQTYLSKHLCSQVNPRELAMSSFKITTNSGKDLSTINHVLRVTADRVKNCAEILLNHFGLASEGVKTPPSVLSPFKVTSSSTPKSTRIPLRETELNSAVLRNTRRQLNVSAINETESETAETTNKENNDSAIGMLSSSMLSSPTVSGSSKTSSQQSSPDSGANSDSPKSNKDIAESSENVSNADTIKKLSETVSKAKISS